MVSCQVVNQSQLSRSTTIQSYAAGNAELTLIPLSDFQRTVPNGIATFAKLTIQLTLIITVQQTKVTSVLILTRELSCTVDQSTFWRQTSTWTDPQCLRPLSSCLMCPSQPLRVDIYSKLLPQSKESSKKAPCREETGHVFVSLPSTKIFTSLTFAAL